MIESTQPPARRRVLKSAAWAAPAVVLSSAAPMAAASPLVCSDPTSVAWTNFVRDQAVGSGNQATHTGAMTVAGLPGGDLTVSAVHNASGAYLGDANNLRPYDPNYHPYSTASGFTGFLWIQHQSASVTQNSTITVSFSRVMESVTFSIGDIDAGSGWWDEVILSSGYTVTEVQSLVTGSGTSAAPFTSIKDGTNIPTPNTGGNVTVTYSNISSFSITFRNSHTRKESQNLVLSPLTVKACA